MGKLRKAIGAVKDQTSIGLAKVGSSTSVSDLEVAIVKATRHEEYPAEERHIREILCLTSYSRAYVGACVSTLSRRLSKTKNWTVALKTLILIQRLLAEGDPAYEQEIFFATRRGTRLLNMSDFRDTSYSNSWDYSAFVRTYALYLDERLEYKMQGRRGRLRNTTITYGISSDQDDEEEDRPEAVCVNDMKTEHIFSKVHHLQQLLDRFLACRPTGWAKNDRVVIVALYPIIKESFQMYYDITEILGVLIDRFMELEISDSVKVYEIFYRVSKQYDELDNFYSYCKTIGVARSTEYPEVEQITQKKLDLMDEFIRDKTALAQKSPQESHVKQPEPAKTPVNEEKEEEEEEDMNNIKALPPPEEEVEPPVEVKEEEQNSQTQTEGDLLNLEQDAMTSQEHADKLALALFDGMGPPTTTTSTNALPWKAFNDDAADWETTLVQSSSHLGNQKVTMPGGFDMLMLDGMYQQGTIAAAMNAPGYGTTGSSSSVALGSMGSPAMLALPPIPTTNSSTSNIVSDPFAASLAVAPPSFVQMSDMEKKQRLLVEEQFMWERYRRDGMQGHRQLGIINQQKYPYTAQRY